MSIIYNPHDYQTRATEWIIEHPKSALWMEMGLGKTVCTLTALVELFDSFDVSKVLIVAPLRVAKFTWPNEIRKWNHTENLPYSVITGTPKQRIKALNSKAPIHIINFDIIVWLVKYVLSETGGKWPYDMVIPDESSKIKNQGAKRYKAIAHVTPAVDYMVQLTGSPASSGLLNLWSQMFLLDGGKRLGNTFKAMRDRWFEPVAFNEYGPKWTIKSGASFEIHERVSDIALSLRAKDYLDLPDDINIPIYVELDDDLREQYDHLEREMWLELNGRNIEAVNGGVLTGKCRQFSNGFLYDENKDAHFIHNLKMNALIDIVDSAEGQPLLVGYQYKEDLAQILEQFPQAQKLGTDPKQLDDWNAGLIPILLAHPASAGHGLNMQDGGHMIVLYGIDWQLELYEQMIARLSRQGQQYPVLVYHIMIKDTIDELMLLRVEDHCETQEALKNGVTRNQRDTVTEYRLGRLAA